VLPPPPPFAGDEGVASPPPPEGVVSDGRSDGAVWEGSPLGWAGVVDGWADGCWV
jgi:hypothetical protein